MGVPAFFRWLSRKYPSIVVHCKEERAKIINGVKIPVDITQPNPNNIEFDNLYLDMNGIIHPCCHPENKAAPNDEDEMMEAIFEYIDRLVALVRPRKLLYMAIDGVAPRAKMNQQRSRRFRASKESQEKHDDKARRMEEMRMHGLEVPNEKPDVSHFDSNCITPGTEFMHRLAECLRYYIHFKMNSDPGWSQIMVLLSDANAPGEGEHKIMDFIRRQRAQPNHDPNTKHCLCGADADLIMLGLATHEPNFTIIREEFKPNQERSCEICGQLGHQMNECQGLAKIKHGEFDDIQKHVGSEQEFIFLRLNVLREYLYKELIMYNLPFEQNIERAIDDWVMMCFFVGNDFLPHLPSLEIREGAIDRLIGLYKRVVHKTGGYLTDSGYVNLDRVQLMLTELGEMEDEIFKKRRETEEEFQRRNIERSKRQKRSYEHNAPSWIPSGEFSPIPLGQSVVPMALSSQLIKTERQQNFVSEFKPPTNYGAASDLRQSLNFKTSGDSASKANKRNNEGDSEPVDDVRLWEDGWKDRYYLNKFGVDSGEHGFRNKVGNEYIIGICWVLRYYYQGCASWNWYFPYHYAPFASDFVGIGPLQVSFPPDTEPFKPLEQLMSVFPAASKCFLPPSWQELMYGSESNIIDFYPTDFKIDLNGKKYAWQGVALLPFVDETRLLKTLQEVYPNLTEYERKRNSLGNDRIFVHRSHKSFDFLECLYENGLDETKIQLDASLTNGIAGLVWCDDKAVLSGGVVKSTLPKMSDCFHNQAICVMFIDPQYDPGFKFHAKLLSDVKMPDPVLKPDDFDKNNPGQKYKPQTGFKRDSGYSTYNDASVANRLLRGNLNSSNSSQFQQRPEWNRNYNRPMEFNQSSSTPLHNVPRFDQPSSNYWNQQSVSGYGNQDRSSRSNHSYQDEPQRSGYRYQDQRSRPNYQHQNYQPRQTYDNPNQSSRPGFHSQSYLPRNDYSYPNHPRFHPRGRQQ